MLFKRIIILTILIATYFVGSGQFINPQTVGGSTTLYHSKGGLVGDSGFIVTNLGDTTYGRQINYYDGMGGKGFGLLGYNGFLYYRYNGAWVKVASSGIIPAQFNPLQGWGVVLSGTYPNITFTVDSVVVTSKSQLQKKVDSLGVVKLNTGDTINLSNRINARVLYTDSNTVYYTPYRISLNYYNKTLSDARFVQLTRNINTTAPILGGGNLSTDLTIHADTGRVATQLATGGGLNKVKDTLVNMISAGGFGTVLSVATTSGTAIISSVATPSSTPNISIKVDTTVIHTWVYDSVNFYPLNSNPNRYWDSVRAKAWSNATFAPISVVNFDTTVLNLTTRFGYKKGWGDYSATGYGFTYNNLTGAFTFDSSKYITWLDTTGLIATKYNLSLYQPIGSYVPTTRTLTINGVTYDLSANRTWNVGTVTSVGLSLPSIFSVSGSPVTINGTLTASLANQNANLVFASATSGSPAQPTFRSLVAADIPILGIPNIDTSASGISSRQWRQKGIDSAVGLINLKKDKTDSINAVSGYTTLYQNSLKVPYNNATSNVNLGIYNLSTSGQLNVIGDRYGPMQMLYQTADKSSYTEYNRVNGTKGNAKAAAGFIGSNEYNTTYNMDYQTGIHRPYDSTRPAAWTFLGTQSHLVFGVQWAIANQVGASNPSYDIWTSAANSNKLYLFVHDSAGNFYNYGKVFIGNSTLKDVTTKSFGGESLNIAGEIYASGKYRTTVAGEAFRMVNNYASSPLIAWRDSTETITQHYIQGTNTGLYINSNIGNVYSQNNFIANKLFSTAFTFDVTDTTKNKPAIMDITTGEIRMAKSWNVSTKLVNLNTDVSGYVDPTKGGTGLTSMNVNTIYKGNGTSAMTASGITDDGTNVALTSRALSVSGTITASAVNGNFLVKGGTTDAYIGVNTSILNLKDWATNTKGIGIDLTTGAVTASSSITGNGFIKSGGTSSQALIADGSVLGFTTANTASTLAQRDANGIVSTTGLNMNGVTYTASANLDGRSMVVYGSAGTNTQTLTLPNPSGVNYYIWIKNISAYSVTVAAYAGTGIFPVGSAVGTTTTLTLTTGGQTLIWCDGNAHYVQLQ